MELKIREAVDGDKNLFVEYAVKLSNFNRSKHDVECKYDDYKLVVDSIQRNAEKTFSNRDNNILILIAELDCEPVGYALGKIFQEDEVADNGTGKMGLFDELFVDNTARGLGVGYKLLKETIEWFKKSGINRVKLHVYAWNNNAKRLYEQNGFSKYVVSYEKFL